MSRTSMGGRLRTVLILTWTVLAVCASGPTTAQAPVPVLVELFTSEGCSSCPPADQLLSELSGTQPVDGVRIVALSEHVDYWNHQGWKDPFSSAIFTRRQAEHAGASPSEVYTPQVVVDGGPGVIGSDRGAVLRTIREAAASAKVPVSLAWTGEERGAIEIVVTSDPRTSRARVFLAVTEDGLQSNVQRGENEGRSLRHDAVTRRLIEAGRADSSGAFRRTVAVPVDPGWRRPRLRIVAFVQAMSGTVVGVEVLPAG